jgi:hypothetical protein
MRCPRSLLFITPLLMLLSLLWAQTRIPVESPSRQRINEANAQAHDIDSVDLNRKRQLSSDGQWKMNDLVKAQYAQLTSDTEKLTKLTNELKTELANPNVLSVGSMRKAEEIEKLAKKVRSRLKGWF